MADSGVVKETATMENLITRLLSTFAAVIARLGWQPSAQQLAIFAHLAYSQLNLVVRARAGTGKTTTIMAALHFLPRSVSTVLVAAFSKDIADELTSRAANISSHAKIDARSLHSLGNGIVWYQCGAQKNNTEIDQHRGRRLARKACTEKGAPTPDEMIVMITKLASLGKNCVPFARTGADLMPLVEQFNLVPEATYQDAGWTPAVIADFAARAMELATMKETNSEGKIVYDFDDQIYLPVRMKWARPKFDLVIIDEAQDMNVTQLLLAQAVAKGKIIVVGDDRQAIYAFRGADSNSIDRLKTELSADELPLTVTYRCGRQIVELARTLVPDYEAAPNAHEGEIVDAESWTTIFETAQGGDFVLSRTNAQVTAICLRLLRKGKPAFIRGRDVGKMLSATLKKILEQSLATSIPELVAAIRNWRTRQIEFLVAKAGKDEEGQPNPINEQAADAIIDQAETLLALAEDAVQIYDIQSRLENLFTEEKGGPATICCSSIHRAKGLEADRVFLLVDTLRNTSTEEQNIAYVGITRAKKTLVRVEGKNN